MGAPSVPIKLTREEVVRLGLSRGAESIVEGRAIEVSESDAYKDGLTVAAERNSALYTADKAAYDRSTILAEKIQKAEKAAIREKRARAYQAEANVQREIEARHRAAEQENQRAKHEITREQLHREEDIKRENGLGKMDQLRGEESVKRQNSDIERSSAPSHIGASHCSKPSAGGLVAMSESRGQRVTGVESLVKGRHTEAALTEKTDSHAWRNHVGGTRGVGSGGFRAMVSRSTAPSSGRCH